ncbi:alpha/beta fold hydrolase [Kitasatospora sp. NPDC101183]|uniref:alpha/beta fold hydrolase n=1 Tax=Kitasatospora sp. NPDC101183 TaxID=3364100 RepID=UPI003810A5C4
MNTTHPAAWTGTVAVEDTVLAVTDTGGAGTPVVYLNGSYADQAHWRRVIDSLGSGFRHITFDERARGRSGLSGDYSFEACLRDLDAVLAARGVERPILVGWSYGALIAVNWASRNPGRVRGVVSVDGAYPYKRLDAATQAKVRRMFARFSLLFPIARRMGMAGRMSAAQHADINLELIELCAHDTIEPVLDRITDPVRWVVATGGSLGGDAESMEGMRANLDPVLARNPHLAVHTRVGSNHTQILRKDSPAVADTVRELAREN